MFLRGFCIVSAVCLFFANAVVAQSIQVLRFLDNAKGAIVRTADGKTKTIKVGDVIKSYELRVTSSESRERDEDKLRVPGCEGKDKDQLRVTSSGLKEKDEDGLRITGSELKNKDKLRGTSEELRNTKHGTRNTEQRLGLRVIEISEGRVVFEERTNKGLETVIIRVENGKQKIERISKVPDSGPGYMTK